jgi:FKBP-type peptidyl-prolyl cis-trans isomerase FklB
MKIKMKQYLTLIMLTAVVLLSACKTQKPMTEDKTTKLETKEDSFSYVLGMDIANFFTSNPFELNEDAFIKGFSDKYSGDSTLIDEERAKELIMEFQQEMGKQQEAQAKEQSKSNRDACAAFMAENKTKDGVQETQSGLQYKVITEGTGNKPAATDKVKVHYEGKLINGTIFDSSYQRGEPITFGLNQVIPGWTEGLQLMSEGAVYELYIPTDLGYGDRAAGQIPPGSCLIFKVELISIEK